jgi:hypothetical protein
LDLAHRALAAEIRSDLKDILAESSGNSIGGTPAVDAGKLDEIKKLIESFASRQTTPIAQSNDPAVIRQAVLSALESQKKGVVSVDHLLLAIKDAAREVISSLGYAYLLAFNLGSMCNPTVTRLPSRSWKNRFQILLQRYQNDD